MLQWNEFEKIFSSRFWQKLKDSLVPYRPGEKPSNKRVFLKKLYDDILNRAYFPEHPRDYIVSDKHNYVARIVPAFGYRENCVYFFAIKMLEDKIAGNRVNGTYGGWRLGNPIRSKEEQEFDLVLSASLNSYNKFAWVQNWRDFQKKAYAYSSQQNYGCFIKFDIANFYDSINLDLLEKKIRLIISHQETFVVELLFHFLRYWNRKFENYYAKSVGLPQDEIGDMSRMLANFYLQDYDTAMKDLCDQHSSAYLRYADDQIIYAPDCDTGLYILFEASKELFKINLNINSSKVTVFRNRTDFERYWAFEIFEYLGDKNNTADIARAVTMYFDWKKKKYDFRWESVLTRLLSMNLDGVPVYLKHRLFSEFLTPEFLAGLSYWAFQKLYNQLSGSLDDLYKVLDPLIPTVKYNSFHYNLLKFYKKHRPGFDTKGLENRIDDLKVPNHAFTRPAFGGR